MAAGKKPSTVRNACFLVRQVLGQVVADGRLDSNPADYVKLPTDHNTGRGAVVDDPALFLTAAQVAALAEATPWPYGILVHLAAWTGLRAAELAGLCVGDVLLPPPAVNPNTPLKLGTLRVERSVASVSSKLVTVPPKTKGSRRRVPLTVSTTERLRQYLAVHPRRGDVAAHLFPGLALTAPRPTGVRAEQEPGIEPGSRISALRQATALAALTVTEAGERLVLDWGQPYRHATFYKAVFRPAVLRANRLAAVRQDQAGALPTQLKFHALRHTYASLCIAAGRPMFEVARFMGHSRPSTTETVYAHLPRG
ncbi:tyrosine-type recombinase/integrase [Mycolicibacterium porcinum]